MKKESDNQKTVKPVLSPHSDSSENNHARLYSERFDDFYAAKKNPLAEKEYVFCQGNQLANRFQQASDFTIIELGFGAGLSFAAAANLWREKHCGDHTLHFISIEKYPLTTQQIRNVHHHYPELNKISKQLLTFYPDQPQGFFRIEIDSFRISLTLIFDEVSAAMQQLMGKTDAWFLDGFSPAKNPQMWSDSVFQRMAHLSHPDTTFATYTAASNVRKRLSMAGFQVKKQPGFAGKREQLIGQFDQTNAIDRRFHHAPWFRPAGKKHFTRHALVIGAGLSGLACANRLAKRGYTVTVVESGHQIAAGTSLNPAAIIDPYLSVDDNFASRFSRQGFFYTLQRIRELQQKNLDCGFRQTGLLSLAKDAQDLARKKRIFDKSLFSNSAFQWVDPEQASLIAGLNIKDAGFYYPQSGWLPIIQLCRALAQEFPQQIKIITDFTASDIKHKNHFWEIYSENNQTVYHAEIVIIANGASSIEFKQTEYLPLRPNRGQLSWIESQENPQSSMIKNAYVISAENNQLFFGSSYIPDSFDISPIDRENHQNLKKMVEIAPELQQQHTETTINSWCGIRAVTPDRLPLAGEVAQLTEFTQRYQRIVRGEQRRNYEPPPVQQGLYILTGLGSRAMTYGLLGAELLASIINNDPLPVEQRLYEAVHPNRFLIRAMKTKTDIKANMP